MPLSKCQLFSVMKVFYPTVQFSGYNLQQTNMLIARRYLDICIGSHDRIYWKAHIYVMADLRVLAISAAMRFHSLMEVDVH